MLTDTFLIYGQPEPPAELTPLRAGPLTMLYDPTSGFVRRITLGEREVLRGIYAAVRDRNWGTPPGTLREIVRQVEAQSFHIEFESEHRQGDIHFVWRGTVRGDADGTLRYEFDGEAKTTFLRNRIGFCVLHPIRECAGARARQTRTDGSTVECRFPELIEPQIFGQSSFRDMRAVTHEIREGLWAELEFEGDTFEMEDQRNWTDASFKTYCTPLTLPFPVQIRSGDRIHQSVTLRLVDETSVLAVPDIAIGPATPDAWSQEIPRSPTCHLPAIGLGVASHGEPLTEYEVEMLRELHIAHLRADLRLAEPNWRMKLDQAATEAGQLGAGLELAIHLPAQGDFDAAEAASAFRQHAARLVRVFALREGEAATTPPTWQRVRSLIKRRSVPIGAGSDCNFCELNRVQALGRLALKEADFLFWSINPQVHARDHLSVMETLEAQAAMVRSARAIGGKLRLVVSPVTLRQRFNPVATGAANPCAAGELPPEADARQLSSFAAAWTMGCLAALAEQEVESVTFYETTGWRGVMEQVAGSKLPARFPSHPGQPFPVFAALKLVNRLRFAADCSVRLREGLAEIGIFERERLKGLVLANLSDEPCLIQWVKPGFGSPFSKLEPYAVVALEPQVDEQNRCLGP